ncbi:MAG: ABC transporter ATP-binding protein [Gemmatimonadaceae bacterium]
MSEPSKGDEPPALVLQGIEKRFGATRALTSASLRVRPGTVHALLGENGAGKSTLMRIAYGMERPDAGTIQVRGVTVRLDSPADAIALGIGMVHQHFTLVPVMTIAENVALGGHGMLDLQRTITRLRELAERTGFALDPQMRVELLSVAAQQRVEIAKALMQDARLLVLDEPTAVLPPSESEALLRWLRSFADKGNAVVLITHKLGEALSVADDVTVLRRGQTVLAAPATDASAASLTGAMLGSVNFGDRPIGSPANRLAELNPARPPIFRAERVTLVDAAGVVRVRDASFVIGAGEIVGIAGVEGGGQRELLRALAGRLPIASGILERPNLVGFVPDDRHRDAMLLDRPLVENVALRGAGVRRGLIDWSAVGAHTESLMRTFGVRAAGSRAPMRTVSGGNQQKLVLARELDTDGTTGPRAIVVENPTRGLDVRAAAEIYDRLRAARDAGAAVAVYSSDIDEVLQLAGRVLVVYAGTVREAAVDREAVGRLMLGAETHDRP